jgi:hypothetical protein
MSPIMSQELAAIRAAAALAGDFAPPASTVPMIDTACCSVGWGVAERVEVAA